jgi:hypothetical protein
MLGDMLQRLSIVLALFILAIAAFSSLATMGAKHHAQRVVKRFHKSLGKYKVELTEVDEQPATGAYWGAFESYELTKNTYVDDLSIWYNGAEISEPMSCYADLANIDSLKITPIKGGMVINIQGGDASTGYDAQIVVKGDKVAQRSVHSGEFRDEDWEKTQYHVESIDN